MRRYDDDRHVLVNERDGSMLHLARGIAFGMDVGNLLELQRPLERDGIGKTATQVKHVARLRQFLRQRQIDRILRQQRHHVPRHLQKHARQPRLLLGRHGSARATRCNRQRCQHRQLAREGLGRGHTDFRTRMGREDDRRLPRDRRPGHIHDRSDMLPVVLAVPQSRERIRRLSGLRDKQGKPATRQRRFAIAELGRDIDLNRHARQRLEPVLGNQRRIGCRPAGNHRRLGKRCEVERKRRQRDGLAHRIDDRVQRVANDLGLLEDLFRHEVAVRTLVDQARRNRRRLDLAVDQYVIAVADRHRSLADDNPVPILQIGDAVGERRQRKGIRSQEHLAITIADGQRRPLPRPDHQPVLAGEDHGQRIGPPEPLDRGRGCLLR